ncbi:MAG: DUF547 domain-containing protein [Lewinellaceae bacterium]|nr:DUF547 domain-containing protein [Lewinellaceae bacterium]
MNKEGLSFLILTFFLLSCQNIQDNSTGSAATTAGVKGQSTLGDTAHLPDPGQTAKGDTPAHPETIPVKLKPEPVKKDRPAAPQPAATPPQPVEKPAAGSAPAGDPPARPAPSARPGHEAWDALLQEYVSGKGKVNYAGFKQAQAKLEAYLKDLADNPVRDNWSKAGKMAYWINAYNAFTIKLILDHYPVSSITDIDKGNPWDTKWINLDGRTLSLNQIENEILRPTFKDPRIHFALNCAARSCPPLLNKAWTADNLNAQLDSRARMFINNPDYNQLSGNPVYVSKIFDWYAADFGNLIDFLNQYAAQSVPEDARIEYREYDWALNK